MADLPNTKEEIFPRLQDFVYYFLKKIEDQFKTSLDVLEGNDDGASTSGSILASLSTIIPVLDTAVSLSGLVYFHRSNKDEARKILIKAAYEIFTCYEMQFVQLTCKGGPIRAIQKFGYDAGQRFLNYCSANKVKVIDEALIIEGIVNDTNSNFLNSLGILKSGTVEDANENSWKIAKIYTKVGVYDKANATCFKTKGANTKKYGHRLKFSYETIRDDWEKDELTYDFEKVTDLKDFEVDYPAILEYIIKKDPEEYAEYDREIKQRQTLQKLSEAQTTLLQDSEAKHRETRSTMVKLHQVLKGESSKQHEVVTQMLEKIKVTQDIIISELPKEPPPPYTVEPNVEVVHQIVEQKIQEQQEEEKILPRIEREVKEVLANIDPTTTDQFKSIKDSISSWF